MFLFIHFLGWITKNPITWGDQSGKKTYLGAGSFRSKTGVSSSSSRLDNPKADICVTISSYLFRSSLSKQITWKKNSLKYQKTHCFYFLDIKIDLSLFLIGDKLGTNKNLWQNPNYKMAFVSITVLAISLLMLIFTKKFMT